MKRVGIGLAVFLAAVVCGYVGWRALDSSGSDASGVASPQAFGAAQQRSFAVLRGPTRPVPLGLQTRLRASRNKGVRSLRLNAARYVSADRGFWAVNGRGVTCIVQAHGGAVSCEHMATFLRNGVAMGVVDLGPPPARRPQEFIVAGLAPNGISAVVMEVDGGTRKVEVRDNSYSLRAPTPILVKRFVR